MEVVNMSDSSSEGPHLRQINVPLENQQSPQEFHKTPSQAHSTVSSNNVVGNQQNEQENNQGSNLSESSIEQGTSFQQVNQASSLNEEKENLLMHAFIKIPQLTQQDAEFLSQKFNLPIREIISRYTLWKDYEARAKQLTSLQSLSSVYNPQSSSTFPQHFNSQQVFIKKEPQRASTVFNEIPHQQSNSQAIQFNSNQASSFSNSLPNQQVHFQQPPPSHFYSSQTQQMHDSPDPNPTQELPKSQESQTFVFSITGSKIKKETQSPFEKKLATILNDEGGLAKPEHVPKLEALMLKEKQLSDESMLLTEVIFATDDPISLHRLVEKDVPKILNDWLQEAKSEGKLSHVKLLLKTLNKLPITVKHLRSSGLGKTVNKLKKIGNPEITARAQHLVNKWKALLQTATTQMEKKRQREEEQKKLKKTAPPAKKVLSSSDDFESELSGTSSAPSKSKSSSLMPDYLQKKRNKSQLVETESDVRKKISKQTHASKPISSDDIRKAKLKAQHQQTVEHAEKKIHEQKPKTTQPDTMESIAPEQPTTPEQSIEPKSISESVAEKQKEVEPKATVEPEKAPQKPGKEEQTEANYETLPSQPQPQLQPPYSLIPDSLQQKKKKKSVSWASQLVSVKEFTRTEEERILQHGLKPFSQARLTELQKDGAFRSAKKEMDEEEFNARQENMVAQVEWHKPQLLENIIEPIEKGSKSKQVAIQQDRESKELQAIYMNMNQIPESPAEPPHEEDYDDSLTPIIPFEEVHKQQTFQDTKGQTSGLESLNSNVTPQILSILKNPQLLQNLNNLRFEKQPPVPPNMGTPGGSSGYNQLNQFNPMNVNIPNDFNMPGSSMFSNLSQTMNPYPNQNNTSNFLYQQLSSQSKFPVQSMTQGNVNSVDVNTMNLPQNRNLQPQYDHYKETVSHERYPPRSAGSYPIPDKRKRKACMFYRSRRGCKNGALCPFSHI